MPNLGPTELVIVLVLVIIVFGVGKLPEVGGALGKSIKEFRKANDEPEPTKQPGATVEARKDDDASRDTAGKRDDDIEREVERRLRDREAARKD
jgi:sec-independent protein translocase protein TatA